MEIIENESKYENIIKGVLEKEKGFSYDSFKSKKLMERGKIDAKGISGLSGYELALRDIGEGETNLLIYDISIQDDLGNGDLEKIIELNEEIAKKLGCCSITVNCPNNKISKTFKNKNYEFNEDYEFFNKSHVGVKSL